MHRFFPVTGLTLWTITAFAAGWFAPRKTDSLASGVPPMSVQVGTGNHAPLLGALSPGGNTDVTMMSTNPKVPALTAAALDSLAAMAAGSDAGAFALTAAVGSLNAGETRRLLEGLKESGLTEDVQRHVTLLLRQQLARLDPVAALHEWRAKPLDQRDGTLTDIFFHLGFRDRKVAKQALVEIEQDFRDQAITSLVQGAAADNQSEGLELAVDLGLQPGSPVVRDLADAWARREPQKAATVAAGLPKDWSEALLTTIMQNWTDNDVAAACAWAEQQPLRTQAAAWPAMVENVSVTRGPAAAVLWAESLPLGSCREAALAVSANRWAMQEPEAASAWAAALPEGALRDATAAALAVGVQEDDPSGAAAWVAAISDPVKRRDASLEFLTNWAAQQPETTLSLFQTGTGRK